MDNGTQTALSGAQFKLYSDSGCTNEIDMILDGTVYRPAVLGESPAAYMGSNASGLITIKGLDAGTYYLKETKAPDGYNLLNASAQIQITRTWTASATSITDMTLKQSGTTVNQIEVENSTGIVLPGTGGIGTRLFYAIGGTLTASAGIVLVARKRVKNEK